MRRIEIFEEVRDTPYRFALTPSETNTSCVGKHKKLKRLLNRAGLEVRPRVCDSSWSTVDLPEEIRRIPHVDQIYHVYLEVLTRGKWCSVDASLDKDLAPTFPVIEWDGYTSTRLCVPPSKVYSPKVSLDIFNETCDQDFDTEHDFYHALNVWFEGLRKS